MKYYYILPDVAGGLGENTIMDLNSNPPIIHNLHYEFFGWFGDCLVSSFPCFLISKRAWEDLVAINVTGAKTESVEITKSDEFEELFKDTELPDFLWLQIIGKDRVDDIGFGENLRELLVSEPVLNVLTKHGLPMAVIAPYDEGGSNV